MGTDLIFPSYGDSGRKKPPSSVPNGAANDNNDHTALLRARLRGVADEAVGGANSEETAPAPRPHIYLIPGRLAQTIAAAEQALKASGLSIYQFGGELVAVRGGNGADKATRFVPMSTQQIRLALANAADWAKVSIGADGECQILPTDPPLDLCKIIKENDDRDFPVIKKLSNVPLLLPDGRVVDRPGLDIQTGVYFAPNGVYFPQVPEYPTRADAEDALRQLLEIFSDFPFASEAARAGSIGLVLTLCGRSVFSGPAPLFLLHAHVAGSGKTLLADVCSSIGTAKPTARMANTGDVEFEKRVTSLLMSGAQIVLIDNVQGKLGSPALDAVLTSTGTWIGRQLGQSKMLELQTNAVFVATGNNVEIGGDLHRRTLLIELDADVEQPETRAGFRHPQLLRHIRGNRPRLVVHALTILKAFIQAGSPPQNVSHFGSFEVWSDSVRNALVWLGMADPLADQHKLRQHANEWAEPWSRLLIMLHGKFGDAPFTAKAALAVLIANESADCVVAAKALLQGRSLNSIALAKVFSKYRGKIVNDLRLDATHIRTAGVTHWIIKTMRSADAPVGQVE